LNDLPENDGGETFFPDLGLRHGRSRRGIPEAFQNESLKFFALAQEAQELAHEHPISCLSDHHLILADGG
jgi:hypothetical protein